MSIVPAVDAYHGSPAAAHLHASLRFGEETPRRSKKGVQKPAFQNPPPFFGDRVPGHQCRARQPSLTAQLNSAAVAGFARDYLYFVVACTTKHNEDRPVGGVLCSVQVSGPPTVPAWFGWGALVRSASPADLATDHRHSSDPPCNHHAGPSAQPLRGSQPPRANKDKDTLRTPGQMLLRPSQQAGRMRITLLVHDCWSGVMLALGQAENGRSCITW